VASSSRLFRSSPSSRSPKMMPVRIAAVCTKVEKRLGARLPSGGIHGI
jgi:hypothetical protein